MPSTVTPGNDPQDIIVSTYFSLRAVLAIVAVLLPPVLYIWGRLHGVSLQYSMSAYYHADGAGLSCPGGHGVARDLFVGGLFAVAGLLYVYRGVTRFENWTLNTAAILAAAIGLFPMPIQCDGIPSRSARTARSRFCFFAALPPSRCTRRQARWTGSMIENSAISSSAAIESPAW